MTAEEFMIEMRRHSIYVRGENGIEGLVNSLAVDGECLRLTILHRDEKGQDFEVSINKVRAASTGGPVRVIASRDTRDLLEEQVYLVRLQAESWCLLNTMTLPTIEVIDHRPIGSDNTHGWYRWDDEMIQIYSIGCPTNSDESFPRAMKDYSPLGCLAHEVGHHAHKMLKRKRVDRLYYDVRCSTEQPASIYARTKPEEDFAETARLFITNPDLLRYACPRRHAFMIEVLKLLPIEHRDWHEILSCMPNIVFKLDKREFV